MGRLRLLKYIVVAIFLMAVPTVSFWISFNSLKTAADTITIQKDASADNFGVVGFISSLTKNTDKDAAVAKMSQANLGWSREEFIYADEMDFAPHDAAYARLQSANIRTMGLLSYPGKDKTHEDWKKYVEKIVSHFPDIPAWEVMNEADNYLTPPDYVAYLKEAKDIIKAINSNAIIVLSGITSRIEAPDFWKGIAAADGWNSFDVVGLHIYHDGNPKEDSYNNGNIGQEVEHAVTAINNSGGGKKIWITETGYDSNVIGADVQANWLSESVATIFNFSEVEKIFVYRLYDHGQGYGILTEDLTEKESFNALKSTIDNIISHIPVTIVNIGQTEGTSIKVTNKKPIQTSQPVINQPKVDKEKSFVRVDGKNILADGIERYRIVVGLKDADQKAITNQKPGIVLSGGKTNLTDPILVGDEWFAYIASTEMGGRKATINAGGQELKTVNLVFNSEVKPVTKKTNNVANMTKTSQGPSVSNQTYTIKDTKKFTFFIIGYTAGSIAIIWLLFVLYYKRQRSMI